MDSDAHDGRPYAVGRARITVPRVDFQEAGDVEASSFVRGAVVAMVAMCVVAAAPAGGVDR